jgi:PTH1 family peptidyl-tRNA hydrolase
VKLVAGLGNPGSRYAASRHNVGFRIVADLARRCCVSLDQTRFEGRYGAGHVPESPQRDRESLQRDRESPQRDRESPQRDRDSPQRDREGPRPTEEGSPRGPGEALGLLQPATYMNASGRALAAAVSELGELDLERDLLIVYDDVDLPLGRIRLRPSGSDGGHGGLASIIDALGTRNVPRLRFGIGRPAEGREVRDFVLEPFSSAEEQRLERDIPRASLAALTALQAGVPAAMNRFNRDPEHDPELPTG